MQPKKIAFIKKGTFSHINESVEELLKREFPDCQIEILNAPDIVYADARNPWILNAYKLINRFFAIKEFGIKILLGRKKMEHCLIRTSYYFKRIKKAVANHLATDNYIFTFQTQSLFDASVPGLPHFIYTDHASLATLQYPGLLKSDYWPRTWFKLERTIYPNASLIFTMSTNISKCFIDQYACDPTKVICVYAGNNAKPIATEMIDVNRYAQKNILFVGVDWERKGGPVLLEAFRNVLKIHPDARLTIVGCSPQVDAPNCNVVGRVPLSEVSGFYEQASLFCLPTRLEALGIVFLEAFAHKLPVVATNLGGIPDFVSNGKNGYLVEYNDVETLANRLIELLEDPKKCEIFGENGYRAVMERYNWNKVGVNIRKNIELVLQNGK